MKDAAPRPKKQDWFAGWTEPQLGVRPGALREPYQVDCIPVVNGAVRCVQVTQNDHMAEKHKMGLSTG